MNGLIRIKEGHHPQITTKSYCSTQNCRYNGESLFFRQLYSITAVFMEKLVKVQKLLAIAIAAGTLFMVQANEDVAERIKPYGQVKVAGAVAATAAAGPRSGKDIYNQACTACHSSGVLGAPKTKDAADWKPRLDAKGFDTVWQNAINGINAMPPMGTCGSCSEDDIKAAIEYMIEGVE